MASTGGCSEAQPTNAKDQPLLLRQAFGQSRISTYSTKSGGRYIIGDFAHAVRSHDHKCALGHCSAAACYHGWHSSGNPVLGWCFTEMDVKSISALACWFKKELCCPERSGGHRTIIAGIEVRTYLTRKIKHPLDFIKGVHPNVVEPHLIL